MFFASTNSVDTDEMQHYAAFHLGRHCLQKNSLRGFSNTKGLIVSSLLDVVNGKWNVSVTSLV